MQQEYLSTTITQKTIYSLVLYRRYEYLQKTRKNFILCEILINFLLNTITY